MGISCERDEKEEEFRKKIRKLFSTNRFSNFETELNQMRFNFDNYILKKFKSV